MKATQHIETLLIFKHFYTLRGSWRSAESKADLLFVRQQRTSTTFKKKGDLFKHTHPIKFSFSSKFSLKKTRIKARKSEESNLLIYSL